MPRPKQLLRHLKDNPASKGMTPQQVGSLRLNAKYGFDVVGGNNTTTFLCKVTNKQKSGLKSRESGIF